MDDNAPNFTPLPDIRATARPRRRWRWLLAAIISVAVVAAGVTGALAWVSHGAPLPGPLVSARATAVAHANQTEQAKEGNQPGQYSLSALSMDSPADGWAVAGLNLSGSNYQTSRILHIVNGVVVKQQTITLTIFGVSVSLQALSPTDVWLLFSQTPNGLYHYDGQNWTQVAIPAPSDAGATDLFDALSLVRLTMRSPDQGWAIGAYTSTFPGQAHKLAFYHYDGSAWRLDEADADASQALAPTSSGGSSTFIQVTGISAAPSGEVWATGYAQVSDQNGATTGAYGYLYHPTAGVWHVQRLSNQELMGIAMTGARDGWMIGVRDQFTKSNPASGVPLEKQTPLALRWDGARWSPATLPAPAASQTAPQLTLVTATGPDDVWIAGAQTGHTYVSGAAYASNTDYLAHFDGARWSLVSLPQVPTNNPNHDPSVSAQSSFTCVASVGAGEVWIAGALTVTQNTQNQASTFYPLLYHFSGGQWISVALPQAV